MQEAQAKASRDEEVIAKLRADLKASSARKTELQALLDNLQNVHIDATEAFDTRLAAQAKLRDDKSDALTKQV